MMGDILGGPGDWVVCAQQPAHALDGFQRARRPMAVSRADIGHHQIQHVEQVAVFNRKRAIHIALASMQGRIEKQLGAKLGIMKGHRDFRLSAGPDLMTAAGVINDHQGPLLHQGTEETGKKHGG
jgi:hypothetical protein